MFIWNISLAGGRKMNTLSQISFVPLPKYHTHPFIEGEKRRVIWNKNWVDWQMLRTETNKLKILAVSNLSTPTCSPFLDEDAIVCLLPKTFILTCEYDGVKDDGSLFKNNRKIQEKWQGPSIWAFRKPAQTHLLQRTFFSVDSPCILGYYVVYF